MICNIELAKHAIGSGEYEDALQLLCEAENYPSNLGEGKLAGAQENDIHYWKGIVYEKMGDKIRADEYFKRAVKGMSEPVQAIFYNDPQPDKIFYQGLAWRKLNNPEKAVTIFQRLIDFGLTHITDEISIDYFAVSLPGLSVFDADLNLWNKIHCLYMMGLGYAGLNNEDREPAKECFNEVLRLDLNHQGAAIYKQMMSVKSL